MYSPDITKELLCSYLSPDLSDELNEEAGKLKLDGGSPLSTKELQKLLNGAERQCFIDNRAGLIVKGCLV